MTSRFNADFSDGSTDGLQRDGRQDALDLAVELTQTRGLNEALPADDLQRSVDALLINWESTAR